MNRILYAIHSDVSLSSFLGGSLRNAIPRESNVVITVEAEKQNSFQQKFEDIKDFILEELKYKESNLTITFEETELPQTTMSTKDQKLFIMTLYGLHNGVFRMSPAIEDLVETSNNIAKVTVDKGAIQVECLTRSSVETDC